MADIIRDAPLGQILRFVTGNRVLLYPEERPDFELPASYTTLLNSSEKTEIRPTTSRKSSDSTIPSRSDLETGERNVELEKKETAADQVRKLIPKSWHSFDTAYTDSSSLYRVHIKMLPHYQEQRVD